MPCKTKIHNSSTTFSVAIGRNVDASLLIEMSFIYGTGMLIDCDDDVAEARKLHSKPLSLIYRTSQCGESKLISNTNTDNIALTT